MAVEEYEQLGDDPRNRPKAVLVRNSFRKDQFFQSLPYLGMTGLTIYAVFFAASWGTVVVAVGFLTCLIFKHLINQCIEERIAQEKRERLYPSSPPNRQREAIPYHPLTVETYMTEGRSYWERQYQHEGMADTREMIEHAEKNRRDHLNGMCDRKTCYFCHFHDQHAPYV